MDAENTSELAKLFSEVLKMHFIMMQKRLEEINMNPGQPKILHVLHFVDGLTQVELAKIIHVTPPTINAMLKRMERDELIERLRSTTDNRVTHIHLTEKGRVLAIQVNQIMKEVQETCFGNLSEEEMKYAKQILEKLKINLGHVDGECFKKC